MFREVVDRIIKYLELREIGYILEENSIDRFVLFSFCVDEKSFIIRVTENWIEYDCFSENGVQVIHPLSIEYTEDVFQELIEELGLEDCIVESVEEIELEEAEDVYDIEVPGYHNFVLNNGIVVHNSTDSIQQFKLQGFNSYVLSVDRTKEPYIALKNAVNEGRLIAPKVSLLEAEYADVEDDTVKNKIDHTPNGCLPGYVKIKTKKGFKYLFDLAEDDILYSYDKGQLVETGFKDLRITKYADSLMRVALVNGEKIDCTGNHPILTLNGYIQAAKLSYLDLIICLNENKCFSPVAIGYMEPIELLEGIPVYDIEVPSYHNFILENGIVVHNSKDILDSVAANVFKAGTYSAPVITSNTASNLLDINISEDEEEDLENWILPDGYSVVEF